MEIKYFDDNLSRGIPCLQQRINTVILVQDVHNMKFGVLVSLPSCGDSSHYADFGIYLRSFILAVDYGVKKLPADSVTRRRLESRCCSKYADIATRCDERRKCCYNCHTSLFSIWGEDIMEWGGVFNTAFLEMLKLYKLYQGVDVNVYTVAYRQEQNMQIELAYNYFENFNVDRCHSIVVNLARDFKMDNTCLFWHGGVISAVLNKAASHQYFPAFTGSFGGNFIWTNFNENQQTLEPFLHEIRVCSWVTYGLEAPGSYPSVMKLVAPNSKEQIRREFDAKLRWIRALEGNVNNTINARRVKARVECKFIWNGANIEGVCDKVYRDFVNAIHHNNQFIEYLMPINFDDFNLLHIHGIYQPLKNTLSELIEEWNKKLKENKLYIPSIEDLMLAVCLEGMLCWWCYGTFIKSDKPQCHMLNDLSVYLHLNNLDWFRESENVLLGMPLSSPLKVIQDKVILAGKYNKTLIYYGNWTSDNFLSNEQVDDLLVDPLNDLKAVRLLDDDNGVESDSRVLTACEILSSLVWKLIEYENNKNLSCCNGNWDRLREELTSNIESVPVESISCEELVSKIAETEHVFRHQNIQQLFASVKKVCKPAMYVKFKQTCALLLEQNLWESTHLGAVLTLYDQTKYFVLPTCGRNNWNQLGDRYRYVLLQNLRTAIQVEHGTSEHVEDEDIQDVLLRMLEITPQVI